MHLTYLRSQANTEVRKGIKAKVMEDHSFLSCSPWQLAPFFFFIQTRTTCSRGSTTQSRLDLPTSIINQESAPQTSLQTSLMAAFSQLRFPSSQMIDCSLCQTDKDKKKKQQSKKNSVSAKIKIKNRS